MAEYRVLIPDEEFQVLEFVQDDLPGIAVINIALRAFEPKIVFGWHCSVLVHFDDLIDDGMPSIQDRTRVEEFEDEIAEKITGVDKKKPNALYLGRITWNKTRELIWRVYEPEPVDELLRKVINEKEYRLPFDYKIEPDDTWELTNWHLKIY